jgi:glucose-1-phosphate adenylyltransferase
MGMDKYRFNTIDGQEIPRGIGPNCEIRKAIIDKDCSIGEGVKLINKDNIQEYEDDYVFIRDGIIVVPRRRVIPPGYEI